VVLFELLDAYIFLCGLLLEKAISCLRFSANRGLGGKVLLEEKNDSRAKYNSGIMHL